MKKWYMPLTVLGLGGLGVLFGTEKGRETVRRVARTLDDAPERISEINATLDDELANIQSALNNVAKVLGKEVEQIIH